MVVSRSFARGTLSALLTLSLALPHTAFAAVRVDDVDLVDGENAVGGGTATYLDSTLDMYDVTAGYVTTDEDLTVNFEGGNEIDHFQVTGDAEVEVNFEGENEVEDIEAYDTSDVTVNMNEHNDFEDIEAHDDATLTVNVTGEAECEAIKGYDDADVTVRGTTCPQKDVVEVGEDEVNERIGTERGNLVIEDVTVVMESKEASVGSESGNVDIKCSKIESGDDNERTDIHAGGNLFIGGSVIDITGTISSDHAMTIRRSDVDVEKADSDNGPYRIWAYDGITLIEESNGTVLEGKIDGKSVSYVDTGDGEEVHLKSALRPCYYKCDDGSPHLAASKLPKTGDVNLVSAAFVVGSLGALLVWEGLRRRPRVEE